MKRYLKRRLLKSCRLIVMTRKLCERIESVIKKFLLSALLVVWLVSFPFTGQTLAQATTSPSATASPTATTSASPTSSASPSASPAPTSAGEVGQPHTFLNILV